MNGKDRAGWTWVKRADLVDIGPKAKVDGVIPRGVFRPLAGAPRFREGR